MRTAAHIIETVGKLVKKYDTTAGSDGQLLEP